MFKISCFCFNFSCFWINVRLDSYLCSCSCFSFNNSCDCSFLNISMWDWLVIICDINLNFIFCIEAW